MIDRLLQAFRAKTHPQIVAPKPINDVATRTPIALTPKPIALTPKPIALTPKSINGMAAIVACLALSCASGCKDAPQKPKKQPSAPAFHFEEVSSQIERLNNASQSPIDDVPTAQLRPSDSTLAQQRSPSHPQTPPQTPLGQRALTPPQTIPTIDIASALANLQPQTLEQVARRPLSQFPTDATKYRLRVNVQFRGLPKSISDAYDERLFSLLNARAPQPWTLLRSRNIEKNETFDARLNVSFKRDLIRQKGHGKQSPMRTVIKFELSFSFSGMPQNDVSWRNWRYEWVEEAVNLSESAISERFWHDLEARVPVLTSMRRDETAQWMRAQGLSPAILSDETQGISSPDHTYYPDGCLVSHATTDDKRETWIRTIRTPNAPPQSLAIANVEDLRCTRQGVLTLAYDTPMHMSLYYQSPTADTAWKTTIRLALPAAASTTRIHLDDDLICTIPRHVTPQTRMTELYCIDRQTGLARFKTAPIPGAFSGFAYDETQIVVATDQAIAAIARNGTTIDVKKIESRSRLRTRLSCQLPNRLVFNTAPGEFVAYNTTEHVIDWQYRALDSDFLHCGQDNTLLLSESGGYLLAIDIDANAPKWRFKTVSRPRDVMTYRGIVYILLDRAIVALDNATGTLRAQIPLPWRANAFIQIGHKTYIDTPDIVFPWSLGL